MFEEYEEGYIVQGEARGIGRLKKAITKEMTRRSERGSKGGRRVVLR